MSKKYPTSPDREEHGMRSSEVPFGLAAEDILEESPTATLVVDSRCRALLVNRQACEVLGIAREALLEKGGSGLRDHLPEAGKALFDRVFHGGETVRDHRMWIRDARGNDLILSLNVTPIRGTVGAYEWAVATFADITAQTWVEDALQLYMDRLAILRDVDRAILAVRPSREIAELAVKGMRSIVPYDAAALYLIESTSGGFITLMTDVRDSLPGGSVFQDPPKDCKPFLDVLAPGEVVLFSDVDEHPGELQACLKEYLRSCYRSAILAPLLSNGNLIGCLFMAACTAKLLTEEHASMVKEACAGLAVSLQNASLIASLEQKSKDITALARRLELAREEERGKLSHELHDGVGQILASLEARLNAMQTLVRSGAADPAVVEGFSDAIGILNTIEKKIREAMHEGP